MMHYQVSPSLYNLMNENKKEKKVYSNGAHLYCFCCNKNNYSDKKHIFKIIIIIIIILTFSVSAKLVSMYVVSIDKYC